MRADLRFVLDEAALPLRSETLTTCELLGLDPLYLACEGRMLIWVAPRDTERLLQTLRRHPLGRDAAWIGRAEPRQDGPVAVLLKTTIGGERPWIYCREANCRASARRGGRCPMPRRGRPAPCANHRASARCCRGNGLGMSPAAPVTVC